MRRVESESSFPSLPSLERGSSRDLLPILGGSPIHFSDRDSPLLISPRDNTTSRDVVASEDELEDEDDDDDDDEDDDDDDESYDSGDDEGDQDLVNIKSRSGQDHGSNERYSEPLPLLHFKADPIEVPKAQTITGEAIDSVPNHVPNYPFTDDGKHNICDPLQSPQYTNRLAKWFIARNSREMLVRKSLTQPTFYGNNNAQGKGSEIKDEGVCGDESDNVSGMSKGLVTENPKLNDYLIFDSRYKKMPMSKIKSDNIGAKSDSEQYCMCTFIESNITDTKNKPSIELANVCPSCVQNKSLEFSSQFESGNLHKVTRTEGRENLTTHLMSGINVNDNETGEFSSNSGEYAAPTKVDQEYNLWLRKDINTSGNIQWYYFCTVAPIETSGLIYPLKVRFQIVNMMKKDALYNVGMKPAVLSSCLGEWGHAGDDICYYKNGLTNNTIDSLGNQPSSQNPGAQSGTEKKKKKKIKYFSTLCFTYTFQKPGEVVYFAHCYPYTYTDLQMYLRSIEINEKYTAIVHRRVLCTTLAGNRCDLLTITSRSKDKNQAARRPAIVLTARVHPGESNSSYAMHGLINFLLSDVPDAVALRNTFIFKIVPMMNPDGVIHGNYRCSLAATDLNRRYANCSSYLHPTVHSLRSMLGDLQETRGVHLYLDIHGHSKKKNVFLYGCDIVQQPENWVRRDLEYKNRMEVLGQRVHSRTFAKVLCGLSNSSLKESKRKGYFNYDDCKFTVSKGKRGTGRVVAWRDIGIEGSYTIELSFCGTGFNEDASLFKKAEERGFDALLAKEYKMKNSKMKFGGIQEDIESNMSPSIANDYRLYKEILKDFETAAHFTKVDMLKVGIDIGLAISHFSNLPHAYNFPSSRNLVHNYKSSHQEQVSIDSMDTEIKLNSNSSSNSNKWETEIAVVVNDLLLQKQMLYEDWDLTFYDITMLKKPLLHHTSFSSDAQVASRRLYPQEFLESNKLGNNDNRGSNRTNPKGLGGTESSLSTAENNMTSNVGIRMKAEIDLCKQFGYVLENPITPIIPIKSNISRKDDSNKDKNNNEDISSTNEEEFSLNKCSIEESSNVDFVENSNQDSDNTSTSLNSLIGSKFTSQSLKKSKIVALNQKKKKLPAGNLLKNDISKVNDKFLDFFIGEFVNENNSIEESDGSDSEPSVDNVPTESMLKRIKRGIKADGGASSGAIDSIRISNALRVAAIKQSRKNLLDAKKIAISEKKKMVALQKQQLQEHQEARLLFDLKQSRKTFSNSSSFTNLSKSLKKKKRLSSLKKDLPINIACRKIVRQYPSHSPSYKLEEDISYSSSKSLKSSKRSTMGLKFSNTNALTSPNVNNNVATSSTIDSTSGFENSGAKFSDSIPLGMRSSSAATDVIRRDSKVKELEHYYAFAEHQRIRSDSDIFNKNMGSVDDNDVDISDLEEYYSQLSKKSAQMMTGGTNISSSFETQNVETSLMQLPSSPIAVMRKGQLRPKGFLGK